MKKRLLVLNMFYPTSIMQNVTQMKVYTYMSLLAIILACSSTQEWTASKTTITEDLHDIEVINDKNAIAYSYGTGNIYKTRNAGKNWQKIYQFDSTYFEQIQFLDLNNGWLIGSPNKIYHTQNGGKTWISKALSNEFEQSYLYGMYFEDSNTGYVAALLRDKNGFRSKIFKTDNGGETWEIVNEVAEMILNLEKIEDTLYAMGNNVIIKNVEDSENWSYCFQDTSKQVGQIRDIAQNAGKTYAASFNGYIIELEECSSNIQQISKNRIRSLISTSNNNWIAVGDNNKEQGNYFTSTDNGINWKLTNPKYPDIHRISKGKNTLWIVGKEGLLMRQKR